MRPRRPRPARPAPAPTPAAPSPGPELPPAARAAAPAGTVEAPDLAAGDDGAEQLEHHAQLARLRTAARQVTRAALRAELAPHLARLVALHDEAAATVAAMRAIVASYNARSAAVSEMAKRLGLPADVRQARDGDLRALAVQAMGVRPSVSDWLTPSPDREALAFRMCRLMGEPEVFAFRDDPELPEVLASGSLGAYRRRRADDARFERFVAGQRPRR